MNTDKDELIFFMQLSVFIGVHRWLILFLFVFKALKQ